jgi:hypothetical protein
MWNIDSNHEGEEAGAHFQEHLQHISLYQIMQDTIIAKELGVTKGKYDLGVNDTMAREIKRKEKELVKEVHWEDYN